MLSSGITIRVSGVSSATKKIKHSGEIQFAVSDGLSQQLWLAGESFSLADIGLTPYITRVDRRGLDGMWQSGRTSGDGLPQFRHVQASVQR